MQATRSTHLLRVVGTTSSRSVRVLPARRHGSLLSEDSQKHTPYGSDGSGLYSLATRGCYDVMRNAKADVLSAGERALAAYLKRRDSGPFVVADYGTADGGTSMPLLSELLKMLTEKAGRQLPILVVYEDQAQNDFKSLFLRLHGHLPMPEGEGESYLMTMDNVHAVASGTSFYNRALPNNFVDLSFSATAMHWLSRLPAKIPDALHSAYTNDAAAKDAFREQAAADWSLILAHRANEMKSGAEFVCVNFAKDEQGQFLGHTQRTEDSMHHSFARHWQQMADEGLLRQEEVLATNFPNQYRTLEEVSRPFESGVTSPAAEAGLQLREARTEVVQCPYLNTWLADPTAIDAAEHSRNYVPTTRTWSNSTFYAGLDQSRPVKEREALVDEMFERYRQQVEARPTQNGMDYVHSYLTMTKK